MVIVRLSLSWLNVSLLWSLRLVQYRGWRGLREGWRKEKGGDSQGRTMEPKPVQSHEGLWNTGFIWGALETVKIQNSRLQLLFAPVLESCSEAPGKPSRDLSSPWKDPAQSLWKFGETIKKKTIKLKKHASPQSWGGLHLCLRCKKSLLEKSVFSPSWRSPTAVFRVFFSFLWCFSACETGDR